MQLIRAAWRLDRRRFAFGSLLLALGSVAPVAVAFAFRSVVEAIPGGLNLITLSACLILGIALAAEVGLGLATELLHDKVADRIHDDLHQRLLQVLASVASFESRERSEFQDDVDLARAGFRATSFAWYGVLQVGALAIQIIVSTLLLLRIQPEMAWLPVFSALPIGASYLSSRSIDRSRIAAAPLRRQAVQYMRIASISENAAEVRAFNMQGLLLDGFDRAWRRAASLVVRGQGRASIIDVSCQISIIGAAGIALYFMVLSYGRAPLGDVVLLATLALQISNQVLAVGPLTRDLMQVALGVQRLNTLEDKETNDANDLRPVFQEISGIDDCLRVENVSFQYPNNSNLSISDISFELKPGTVAAVVGENGAGKSTLVKLLAGLYQPSSGSIRCAGVSTKNSDKAVWRSSVSAVFQNFSRPAFRFVENITLSRNPGTQAFRAALTVSRADEVEDQLPQGVETILGREYGPGTDLSGGQWQRVAIARAAFKEAPIVIFDEPDSALDAHAERELFDQISGDTMTQNGNLTIRVLATHRLTSAIRADIVLFLEDGHLSGHGTHQQLMASNNRYSALYNSQAVAYGIHS